MNVTGRLPIVAVILAGILLGTWLLIGGSGLPDIVERFSSAEQETESGSATGSRGGELFTKDDLSLELIIHEEGVFPHFRIYPYWQKQSLSPAEVKVTVALSRLGRPAQLFHFRPESDYLISDQEVEEPHSFELVVAAEYQARPIAGITARSRHEWKCPIR